jgi:hypothetical protein
LNHWAIESLNHFSKAQAPRGSLLLSTVPSESDIHDAMPFRMAEMTQWLNDSMIESLGH